MGFPGAFAVVERDGALVVDGVAASAAELVDVLGTGALETAVVLNVGQNSWMDDYEPWTLGRIARHQGVRADVHDIRWAASPRFRSDDLLVLPWEDLPRLLDGWSAYGIEIFDCDGTPDPDALALAVNTAEPGGLTLPALPGARVYFSGHDDFYVHVETRDDRLPGRIFGRLLGLQADAAPPPGELVDELLRHGERWVSVLTSAQGTVALELVPTEVAWRLHDPVPPGVSHVAVVEGGGAGWELRRV
ncbi:hypothetical protein [Spirillospora sp. CA-294931]|uniref:hypothetical protein n=1 Tax=Spirillospora sp. CA-294931 TaxID=3240042 RepID=UPI003D8C78D2